MFPEGVILNDQWIVDQKKQKKKKTLKNIP